MTVLEAIAAGCRHKSTILARLNTVQPRGHERALVPPDFAARELQRLRRAALIEWISPREPVVLCGWRLTERGRAVHTGAL